MLVLRAYGKVAPISTYIQGFLADNKEGTLLLYHSKGQITTTQHTIERLLGVR